VADVQQVEATIGKANRPAGAAIGRDALGKLRLTDDAGRK
jgi:hypothetical protein